MNKYTLLFACLWLSALLPVSAAGCEYPRSPQLPNGELASEDEMRAAQKDVRAFLAAAEEYLSCLSAMEEQAGDSLSPRQAEINVARYNAMVDEMHRVSDEYNIAVRIFKSRQ